MIVLAKSQTPFQEALELWEHTEHVVHAIDVMAEAYGFPVAIARKGAVLHDLGKGHPAFQAMLIEKPIDQREAWLARLPAPEAILKELGNRNIGNNVPHRHELSSLMFLPLFPQEEWPELIDMVVAHHKSVKGDVRARGLLDFVKENGKEETFDHHATAWEHWSPVAGKTVERFGYSWRGISREEAKEAFFFTVQHVKKKDDGWSKWRGLLMGADHFGSGYQFKTQERIRDLYRIPDLSFYEARTKSERAKLYPLTQIDAVDSRPHTLVTAPTGAGKTDFLLRRCQKRVFYTLPFQASINAMYSRVQGDLPNADVRRLHAASLVELDDEKSYKEETDLQQHPGASVKIMTPHQLAAIVFALPKHEMIALDLQGNDVILDEVHTYDELARRMILDMVRRLVKLGCRVHIGTATLPGKLAEMLTECLGGREEVYELSLPEQVLDTFDRHVVHKTHAGNPIDEDVAKDIIAESLGLDEHILYVSNRVASAQERYRWAKDTFPNIPILLIHSRFRRGDRKRLEQLVLKYQDIEGPCLVCATQVVEVSLDISFDRMVTDAAPIDALIQRFGRVNRKRSPDTIGHLKPIHIIAPPEKKADVKPYDFEIVHSSYRVLPDGERLREQEVQNLIDQVYPDVADTGLYQEKNIHYPLDETGTLRIRELRNQARSVIVEALEIEGDTCVLTSQSDNYLKGNFKIRPGFEIPVSGKWHFGKGLTRLETGSYPLLIPDEWYSNEWGLDPKTLPDFSDPQSRIIGG